MKTNIKMNRLMPVFLILLFSLNITYSQIQNLPFPNKVTALSFSPDGKYIVGSIDKPTTKGEIVFVWDISGRLLKSFKVNITTLKINCLSISPDSKYILLGGYTKSGVIIMMDINSGDIKFHYNSDYLYDVNYVSFSPDGKCFAVCSGKIISIWLTEIIQLEKILKGHTGGVLTTVFSPDSKYLYSGSADKKIIQWDIETGQIIRTFLGHKYSITTIDISPDGNSLVSGSNDGLIFIWDLTTGSSIKTLVSHEGPINSVCFSPDSKYIISGSDDNSLKIFEKSTGILIGSYISHQEKINVVDISPDGKLIASGSDDRSIKLWNSNIKTEPTEEKIISKTIENITTDAVPVIIWEIPYKTIDTSIQKEYTINAYIQSKSQLKSVSIYHNSLTRNFNLTSYLANTSSEYNLTVEQNLLLDNGNNNIIINAVNNAGPTNSEFRSVYYEIPVTMAVNEIEWEAPSKENEITNIKKFKVKVCIKSRTKITQISLYLNNNLWSFERTDEVAVESGDCSLKFEKDINLQIGNNEIKIEAINEDNSKITSSRNIISQEPKLEKRFALIIGNSKYAHGEFLLNPVNDAKAMAKVLEKVGFEVESYTDADQKTIKMAMDSFGIKLKNYQVGLFYYAGHGVQVNGNNYIVPVDANLYIENDVEYDCVEVGRILGKMEASGCETNIVILDACRDNPFERKWSGRSVKTQGLAFMNAPSGSIIAYSTAPGNTASDGIGENGLYTSELLKYIQVPNLLLEDVFKNVRSEIEKISNGKQIPWESTSLKGSFYFLREPANPTFR